MTKIRVGRSPVPNLDIQNTLRRHRDKVERDQRKKRFRIDTPCNTIEEISSIYTSQTLVANKVGRANMTHM